MEDFFGAPVQLIPFSGQNWVCAYSDPILMEDGVAMVSPRSFYV